MRRVCTVPDWDPCYGACSVCVPYVFRYTLRGKCGDRVPYSLRIGDSCYGTCTVLYRVTDRVLLRGLFRVCYGTCFGKICGPCSVNSSERGFLFRECARSSHYRSRNRYSESESSWVCISVTCSMDRPVPMATCSMDRPMFSKFRAVSNFASSCPSSFPFSTPNSMPC